MALLYLLGNGNLINVYYTTIVFGIKIGLLPVCLKSNQMWIYIAHCQKISNALKIYTDCYFRRFIEKLMQFQ